VDRTKRRKLKDVKNDDLFSMFEEYAKRIIAEDLEEIYEKKAHLLDSREPWVFQLES